MAADRYSRLVAAAVRYFVAAADLLAVRHPVLAEDADHHLALVAAAVREVEAAVRAPVEQKLSRALEISTIDH